MSRNQKNFIAIIPARAGSKGVKNKNLRKVNGIPLINYTIENCLKSGIFDHTIVSTDSKKIARIAIKYGASIPFIRPKKYSNDNSFSIYWRLFRW